MAIVNVTATVPVDTDDLNTVLRLVGFPEDTIDIAQAVVMAESRGYEDAVGDITLVSAKWGASVGLFQIRSLRSPQSYSGLDRNRYAWPLRNRFYNAATALDMSKGGTDWSPWTGYTSGNYTTYLGQSNKILSGHERSAEWWR